MQGEDKIDVSDLGILDVSQFFVYSDASYTEISLNDFGLGFNGSYSFTNDDFIFAESVIIGTENPDSPVNGTAYGDSIYGLGGNDDLFGLGGNDTISGGLGGDYIELGSGSDVLLYETSADSSYSNGVDYIGDFVQGADVIDVSALGYSDVSAFTITSGGGYTSIVDGDFAVGFNGDYSFTNADFVFV